MAYVRYLISETRAATGGIIRRYEVEEPDDGLQYLREFGRYQALQKLTELELRLTPAVADYFGAVPCSLAESIWLGGLQTACDRLFCCAEYPVLYYPLEPWVEPITDMDNYEGGSIVLDVMTEEEWRVLHRPGRAD